MTPHVECRLPDSWCAWAEYGNPYLRECVQGYSGTDISQVGLQVTCMTGRVG